MSRFEFVIVFVLMAILMFGAVAVIDTAREAAVPCEAPEATGWGPPNLSLCPEDMDLWHCIKDAAYRSDI